MTIDCIWWWGSSSGDLESEVYYFIAITPKSDLVRYYMLGEETTALTRRIK